MKGYFDDAERVETLSVSALHWGGTPFHFNAAKIGVGVDCVNLAAELYKDAGFDAGFSGEEYRLSQGAHSTQSRLMAWLQKSPRFCQVRTDEAKAGDLLCLRIGRVEHHCGVLLNSEEGIFIHAMQRYGTRIERIGPQWERRITAAFRPLAS